MPLPSTRRLSRAPPARQSRRACARPYAPAEPPTPHAARAHHRQQVRRLVPRRVPLDRPDRRVAFDDGLLGAGLVAQRDLAVEVTEGEASAVVGPAAVRPVRGAQCAHRTDRGNAEAVAGGRNGVHAPRGGARI
eukprot:7388538-Prymnesium_polylepis.2